MCSLCHAAAVMGRTWAGGVCACGASLNRQGGQRRVRAWLSTAALPCNHAALQWTDSSDVDRQVCLSGAQLAVYGHMRAPLLRHLRQQTHA